MSIMTCMSIMPCAGVNACNRAKTYRIDFCGQEYAFAEPEGAYGHSCKGQKPRAADPWLREHGLVPARTGGRKAGEQVELCFLMVATDTDYRFIVDGAAVSPDFEPEKGFIIRFTMPEHDVTVRCQHRNSMHEVPEEWR